MRRTPMIFAALLATLLAPGCDSSGDNPLTPNAGVRVVAFVTSPAGNLDVVVFDFDAGSLRSLPGLNSATSDDANPNLAPGAGKIVYQSDRPGGEGSTDLYRYDLANQVPLDSLTLNTPFAETEPAWTGDGAKIAFVRDTLGFKRIRLFDPGAGMYVPLPGLDSMATFNDWAPSPDQTGALIAFVSDRAGTPDVYVYDARMQPPVVRIIAALRSDSVDTEPSLTPSGQWLTFASNRTGGQGGFDIYIYDLLASLLATPNASLNSPADDRNPSISEDGGVLSIESDRMGGVGMVDIWNHNRVGGATGQAAGQSSAMDDLQPSLVWR